jgi:hypothetical protein
LTAATPLLPRSSRADRTAADPRKKKLAFGFAFVYGEGMRSETTSNNAPLTITDRVALNRPDGHISWQRGERWGFTSVEANADGSLNVGMGNNDGSGWHNVPREVVRMFVSDLINAIEHEDKKSEDIGGRALEALLRDPRTPDAVDNVTGFDSKRRPA